MPDRATTSSSPSEAGISFMTLIFVMVFSAWSVAAVITVVDPGLRTGSEDLTQRRFKTIQTAVSNYRSHVGAWPVNLDGLVSDTASAGACTMDVSPASPTFRSLLGWCGPYVEQIFSGDSTSFKRDGYGTTIVYSSGAHTLTSYGRDRAAGGGDDVTFAL